MTLTQYIAIGVLSVLALLLAFLWGFNVGNGKTQEKLLREIADATRKEKHD